VSRSALLVPWLLVLFAGVNSMIGNLFLKQSRLAATSDSLVDLVRSPWFLAGLAFYGLNVVVFAKALDRLPVSAAYPVLAASGFGLLAVVSTLVFGERLSVAQYAGLAITLAGIFLIARG
jgi:multidrug transporter EmrE-like cation transporter